MKDNLRYRTYRDTGSLVELREGCRQRRAFFDPSGVVRAVRAVLFAGRLWKGKARSSTKGDAEDEDESEKERMRMRMKMKVDAEEGGGGGSKRRRRRGDDAAEGGSKEVEVER